MWPSNDTRSAAPARHATCPECGWPDDEHDVVSRHSTSEGVLTWTRCVCGALEARLTGHDGPHVAARGRPSM